MQSLISGATGHSSRIKHIPIPHNSDPQLLLATVTKPKDTQDKINWETVIDQLERFKRYKPSSGVTEVLIPKPFFCDQRATGVCIGELKVSSDNEFPKAIQQLIKETQPPADFLAVYRIADRPGQDNSKKMEIRYLIFLDNKTFDEYLESIRRFTPEPYLWREKIKFFFNPVAKSLTISPPYGHEVVHNMFTIVKFDPKKCRELPFPIYINDNMELPTRTLDQHGEISVECYKNSKILNTGKLPLTIEQLDSKGTDDSDLPTSYDPPKNTVTYHTIILEDLRGKEEYVTWVERMTNPTPPMQPKITASTPSRNPTTDPTTLPKSVEIEPAPKVPSKTFHTGVLPNAKNTLHTGAASNAWKWPSLLFVQCCLPFLVLLLIAQKLVSKSIRRADIAKKKNTKLEIQKSAKILFNNLETQLKKHTLTDIKQEGNSIIITGLDLSLSQKIATILSSAPLFNITNQAKGDLTINFELPSRQITLASQKNIDFLNTKLNQMFDQLSEALLEQKRLAIEESILKKEQEKLDHHVSSLKKSLSEKTLELNGHINKFNRNNLTTLNIGEVLKRKLDSKQALENNEIESLVSALDESTLNGNDKMANLAPKIKSLKKEIDNINAELDRLQPTDSTPTKTTTQEHHLRILREIADQNFAAAIKKITDKKPLKKYSDSYIDNEPANLSALAEETTVEAVDQVDITPEDTSLAPEMPRPENLLFLREKLLGLKTLRVEEPKPLTPLQKAVNHLQPILKNSSHNAASSNNGFTTLEQAYEGQFNDILKNAKCNTANDKTKRKKLQTHFHDLLDRAIMTILGRSMLVIDDNHKKNARRCIYAFLDLCFDDSQNILETYRIVHHSKKDHALTGAGHASNKSPEQLQIQCFILSQLLGTSPTSDVFQSLRTVTYDDLIEFLKTSWAKTEGHFKPPVELSIKGDIPKTNLDYLIDLITSTQEDKDQGPTTLAKAQSKLIDFFNRVCTKYMNYLSDEIKSLEDKPNLSDDERDKLEEMNKSNFICGDFFTSEDLGKLIEERDEFDQPITLVNLLYFLKHYDANLESDSSEITESLPSIDSLREDLILLYQNAFNTCSK